MDLKVYKKEEVEYSEGNKSIFVPDVIDIIPELEDETFLYNAITLEDDEELEQACALSTIWQKGLDPLDLENGNRWSQLFLGEINVIQIMEDLTSSVREVSPSVNIDFDTVKDSTGNSYFTYSIKVVA